MGKVLIACEESQRVCSAFRERGHEAYSCDIVDCSGGHPEWHIKSDCTFLLNGNAKFVTQDGVTHIQPGPWDLIIGHPPCTYLSAASAVRLFDKNHEIKDWDRYWKGVNAAWFFMKIFAADCKHIAVENPTPLKIFDLPPYTQAIQPYEHGEPWQKRTCLWLRGLPKLEPTNIVEPTGYWIGAHGHNKAKNGMSKGFRDQKTRSKTFIGIANAMADQWGPIIEKED